MRRSSLSALILALATPLTSLAFADEPPQDGGAPPATPPPSATVTAPPPVPSSTPVVAPLPPASPTWAVSEDDPLRLLQLIRGEADRQKMARIGGAITSIIAGAGIATTGALILSSSDSTYFKVFGWVTIGTGVLTGVSSLLSFFGSSSLERLADAYQPIAEDTTIPATVRRARGEETLRTVAASEKSMRMINGVSQIILGVAVGALGVGLALSLDQAETFRIPLAFAAGFAGLSTVSSGIGQMVWIRGPSEVAIEHWDAARGAPNVGRLKLEPIVAALPGGGWAGLSLTY